MCPVKVVFARSLRAQSLAIKVLFYNCTGQFAVVPFLVCLQVRALVSHNEGLIKQSKQFYTHTQARADAFLNNIPIFLFNWANGSFDKKSLI